MDYDEYSCEEDDDFDDDFDSEENVGTRFFDSINPKYEAETIEEGDWEDMDDEDDFYNYGDDSEDEEDDLDEDEDGFYFENELDPSDIATEQQDYDLEDCGEGVQDIIASELFEFSLDPGHKENNYPLDDEDYDSEKDLKGDDRAWTTDFVKTQKKLKTENTGVDENNTSSGQRYMALLQKHSNSTFSDPEFPAVEKSLVGHGENV